jgi:SEC-C motif
VPFELTFEEPPTLAARGSIPADRRATLRRAIGEGAIERANALLDAAVEEVVAPETGLIRLHLSGLLEDLKHDWIALPALELLEAVATVAGIDLTDDAAVGGHLRGETEKLVSRAEFAREVLAFLDLFEPSVVHELVRPAYVDGLVLTAALIEWMTAESDEDAADRGHIFELIADRLRENHLVLCGLPYADRVDPVDPATVTGETEFELLFGLEWPAEAQRQIDVVRHFEEAGYDLCDLGRRQLPYLGPYQATHPIWSRNFFELAHRVGQSAYPLLAHRGAFLAWDLFERALAANETETLQALHGLLDQESEWMIDSQVNYVGAIDRYRAGDEAAIVEAYGDLAEGALRRYASVVVALERIAARQSAQEPLVLANFSEIENQLGVWTERPLPALILRFLERGLRNAEAHANVVVEVDGNLRVRQRDGTTETVNPNQVYGRTAGLRSLLDGVDIALNHAAIRDHERQGRDPATIPMPPKSERVFEMAVQHFAEEHTPGCVSGVRRRGDTLTMTYHGPPVTPATYDDFVTFANSLTRLLGQPLPTIQILDEDDEPIEILHPPRRKARVGRNDPCPCGSGKKYKRCHGA